MPEETNVSTYCLVAACSAVDGSCVNVTEVRPANVVAVPPSDTNVLPMVSELLLKAPLGIPVKLVPVRVGAVL